MNLNQSTEMIIKDMFLSLTKFFNTAILIQEYTCVLSAYSDSLYQGHHFLLKLLALKRKWIKQDEHYQPYNLPYPMCLNHNHISIKAQILPGTDKEPLKLETKILMQKFSATEYMRTELKFFTFL